MKLTKTELIQRLINGEKLYAVNVKKPHYCYYDSSYKIPFRYFDMDRKNSVIMVDLWEETEWEVYKENSTWWEPEDGEEAYYVNLTGDINKSKSWKTLVDKLIISQGNVFKTEEEAEKESKLRAAKYRVKKRIWELNGKTFLEFDPGINNYTFALCKGNTIYPTWFTNKVCPNWQLLKSEDLVEQLISEMYEDLKLIRGE